MATFRTYNAPGGPFTNGVSYLLSTQSGVFRPLYDTDFLGGGTGTPSNPASGIFSVQGVPSGYPVSAIPGTPDASSARSIVGISSTFNRPATNNTYTVGYAMANSATAPTLNVISGAALLAGRGGIIQNLVLSKTGTVVTNATFRVHFYNYSGATPPAPDNQPMTGLYTNSPYMLASIDFPTMTANVGAGSVGRAQYQQAAIAYSTVDTPHLYWFMEAQGAYVAPQSEGYTLLATVVRD